MTGPDAMVDEFDTVAGWTATAIAELGEDHAIAGACRGSGVPSALAWFVEQLGLRAGQTLLDVGAGVGGAAEFAARTREVDVVLMDPMFEACRAARRVFGRRAVVADGAVLPFADSTFDAVWALGVLCTVPDQPGLLRELRRVVATGTGRIGLLVFVATSDDVRGGPEGNDFPTERKLQRMLDDAGLRVDARTTLADLPGPPEAWREQVRRVEALVARDHGDDPRWQSARDQESAISGLIGDGGVVGVLLSLRLSGQEPRPGGDRRQVRVTSATT
ncbi:class I SAM-dependent methyltransferase [Williamsia deligens]|uniref:Class I SAM-dependent methyltransferase n=1 Tax=Williamsia deligens TaxID=321325 RepID=A0ABW3G652_9NOCA|nr:class I SAM-dependent methyltransferase [Williamsia deligens]MCP2193570.1 Methyltransferase domain-containing protein [Williamsia deligens]